MAFNEQNATMQNNVRGDVGSVNLRDLGTGSTLLLVNGRRMNLHPGFQTELLVLVVSPDTNEIAPGSVRRIEVLRDGASAIYCADAVAGVFNTVLKGDMKGGVLDLEWRGSDGTGLYSYRISGGLGELLEIVGRPKWRISGSVNWETPTRRVLGTAIAFHRRIQPILLR